MSEPSKKELRRLETARDLEARGHLEHAAKAYVKAGRPADAARLFIQIGRPAEAARALIDSVAKTCPAIAPDMDIEAQALVHAAVAYFQQAGDQAEATRHLDALVGAAPPIELSSTSTSSPELEVGRSPSSPGIRRPSSSGMPAVQGRSPSSAPPPREPSPAPGAERGLSGAPSVAPGRGASTPGVGRPTSITPRGVPEDRLASAGLPSSPRAIPEERLASAGLPSSPPRGIPEDRLASAGLPSSPGRGAPDDRLASAGLPSSPSRAPSGVGVPSPSGAPSSAMSSPSRAPSSAASRLEPPVSTPRPARAPTPATSTPGPQRGGVSAGSGTTGGDPSDFRRAAGWRDQDGGEIEATIRDLLSKGKKGAAARVAWDVGQHERALGWFVEVDLKYQAGACLRALGRNDEALEMMVALSVDDSRYRRACFDIIELSELTGRFDFEVDRFLTRFVAEGPRDPQENAAFLALAAVYERFGFPRGARACVECVLRLSPDEAAAKATLERLEQAERAAAVKKRASRPPPRRVLTSLPPLPSLDEYRALARKHAPPSRPQRS